MIRISCCLSHKGKRAAQRIYKGVAPNSSKEAYKYVTYPREEELETEGFGDSRESNHQLSNSSIRLFILVLKLCRVNYIGVDLS